VKFHLLVNHGGHGLRSDKHLTAELYRPPAEDRGSGERGLRKVLAGVIVGFWQSGTNQEKQARRWLRKETTLTPLLKGEKQLLRVP